MSTSDRQDKDNPNYTFTPQVNYTPQEVEDANKVVEVLNSNLNDAEKSQSVWSVLNKQNS